MPIDFNLIMDPNVGIPGMIRFVMFCVPSLFLH